MIERIKGKLYLILSMLIMLLVFGISTVSAEEVEYEDEILVVTNKSECSYVPIGGWSIDYSMIDSIEVQVVTNADSFSAGILSPEVEVFSTGYDSKTQSIIFSNIEGMSENYSEADDAIIQIDNVMPRTVNNKEFDSFLAIEKIIAYDADSNILYSVEAINKDYSQFLQSYDVPNISLGQEQNISGANWGDYGYFGFTPEKSGYFQFFTNCDWDSMMFLYLYDQYGIIMSDGTEDEDNSGSVISAYLEEGYTYLIGYECWSIIDNFNLYVAPHDADYIELIEADENGTYMEVEVYYEDGTSDIFSLDQVWADSMGISTIFEYEDGMIRGENITDESGRITGYNLFGIEVWLNNVKNDENNIISSDVDQDGDIDSDDAIYLLYHSLLPEEYPVSDICDPDFNGDATVDSDDAIYLLYHTLLPEEYPLKNGEDL